MSSHAQHNHKERPVCMHIRAQKPTTWNCLLYISIKRVLEVVIHDDEGPCSRPTPTQTLPPCNAPPLPDSTKTVKIIAELQCLRHCSGAVMWQVPLRPLPYCGASLCCFMEWATWWTEFGGKSVPEGTSWATLYRRFGKVGEEPCWGMAIIVRRS